MNKDDIKKALLQCADLEYCDDCPYFNWGNRSCSDTLKLDAQNLIAEQEKEIERLKAENEKNCLNCIESKRITADDYSKIQELFAEYQIASEKEIRAHAEREKAFESNMKSVLEIEKDNVRKETAQEIFKSFENAFSLYYPHGILTYDDFQNHFMYLAEKYGVEVEYETR